MSALMDLCKEVYNCRLLDESDMQRAERICDGIKAMAARVAALEVAMEMFDSSCDREGELTCAEAGASMCRGCRARKALEKST